MAHHHPRNAKRPFFGKKGTSREGKVFMEVLCFWRGVVKVFFCHSFIDSFVHSFVRSFLHSFLHDYEKTHCLY